VVAAIVEQHGIRTAGTGIMTIPGNAGLVQAERQMTDAVNNQILPVQVPQVLLDDKDDFLQFVTGDGFQIHLISNGG